MNRLANSWNNRKKSPPNATLYSMKNRNPSFVNRLNCRPKDKNKMASLRMNSPFSIKWIRSLICVALNQTNGFFKVHKWNQCIIKCKVIDVHWGISHSCKWGNWQWICTKNSILSSIHFIYSSKKHSNVQHWLCLIKIWKSDESIYIVKSLLI